MTNPRGSGAGGNRLLIYGRIVFVKLAFKVQTTTFGVGVGMGLYQPDEAGAQPNVTYHNHNNE